MKRLLLAFLTCGALAMAQYKVEAAGEPPAELAAPVKELLAPSGYRVTGGDGKPWCEVWYVKSAPKGPVSTEADLMWKTAPPGSVIGAIRWFQGGYDRRGQMLKPGVYTLRFSMFPINGDHQGVAPNRDFLVMTPAADDQSAAAVPAFKDLMVMSRKASGTPHPAVLSMYVVESDFQAGIQNLSEDWILYEKVGDTPVGLTVAGKSEH
ncbi:MAG: hypothetical protein IT163_05585 [Bryobacterales bacterium]|nr:hypothetical protein [Bryobacterales bacterium]